MSSKSLLRISSEGSLPTPCSSLREDEMLFLLMLIEIVLLSSLETEQQRQICEKSKSLEDVLFFGEASERRTLHATSSACWHLETALLRSSLLRWPSRLSVGTRCRRLADL